MAADILIVKNIDREGPGLLLSMLKEHGITFDVIENPVNCPSPIAYKAMLVYGGPDSANDDTPKMHSELARIKEAIEHNIPYLGICLGMQALVKAAGGKVVKAGGDEVPKDQKEVGFLGPDGKNYSIELKTAGQVDPIFQDLPDNLTVFQLHGETVLLKPEGMVTLATGNFCKTQIVRVGSNAYGIQSHFELTPEMLDVWAKEDPDLQPVGQEILRQQFTQILEEYTKTGQQLFTNFLKIAGLVK